MWMGYGEWKGKYILEEKVVSSCEIKLSILCCFINVGVNLRTTYHVYHFSGSRAIHGMNTWYLRNCCQHILRTISVECKICQSLI